MEPRRFLGSGGFLRTVAPEADDDRIALVEIALQHLGVLVVAQAGFQLDVTERPVRREDVDGALLLRARLDLLGFAAVRTEAERTDWEAEGMVANWRMTRDGSGGFDRVTNHVENVSGRAPLELEHFLTAHRDAFTPTS